MRILLIPASYPPVLGGVQTASHALATNLLLAGHQVQVLTNRYPRNLSARETLDGVPVQRTLFLNVDPGHLRRRRPDLFAASLCHHPATLRHCNSLMTGFKPEVVNVHYPDPQVPFVLALQRRFNFRLIGSLHGHEVERWFAPSAEPELVAKARFIQLLRQAQAVTAPSRYLLDRAASLEPSVQEKGIVTPNGIDCSRFQDREPYQHQRPYVLAVGRLTRDKGFALLVVAFSKVAPAHPEVDLILAGDGEEQGPLLDQARQLGLEGRVILFGRAEPTQVVRLLNGCLFLAVPSLRETFGIAALEAMASGRLVLATRVGGLPEFVTGENNLLVDPTVEGLAEGLGRLLENEAHLQTLGEANRALAAQYTWLRSTELYLRAFGA